MLCLVELGIEALLFLAKRTDIVVAFGDNLSEVGFKTLLLAAVGSCHVGGDGGYVVVIGGDALGKVSLKGDGMLEGPG